MTGTNDSLAARALTGNMAVNQTKPAQSGGERSQWWLETAIRLMVLGLPGLLLVLFCWVALITELSYGEPLSLDPGLGVPLALAGGLMILGSIRQLKRWGYLWVFLSVPFVAFFWSALSPMYSTNGYDPLTLHPKLLGMLLFVLPAWTTFAVVNLYYRRSVENPK